MSTAIAYCIVAVLALSPQGLGLDAGADASAEIVRHQTEVTSKSSLLQQPQVAIRQGPDVAIISLTAVAGASCMLLLLIVTLYGWKRYRRSQLNKNSSAEELTLHFKYDRHRYELPEDRLDIDKAHILGEGHFGTVYKGVLTINDTGDKIPAAFKSTTMSSRFKDLETLLSEVRILSHVGSHENIVAFYGACTKYSQEGIVHVALEFCALGSLDKYLRILRANALEQKAAEAAAAANKNSSNNSAYASHDFLVEDDLSLDCASICSSSFETVREDKFCVQVALQWAVEIAKGMEHLASKNVVHADLATRNLLLTEDKSIKITDFGLSKKIYARIDNNQTCTLDKNQRVPWKWMAPESLTTLTFSSKSDAWSYGVVLWEIFSLGEAPHKEFDKPNALIEFLKEGGRLEKPPLCPNEIFDVMTSCWNHEPRERPTFSEIKRAVTPKDENYVVLDVENVEE